MNTHMVVVAEFDSATTPHGFPVESVLCPPTAILSGDRIL